jgi:histidinol dehydrogenase
MEKRLTMGGEWRGELESYVKSIVIDVKDRGNAALVEYTKKFDSVALQAEDFCVTKEEIDEAYSAVSEEQILALRFLKEKIEKLEEYLLKRISFTFENGDIKVIGLPKPIQSVGCYVPGGEATYPSTVVMTVVPSKVAGVPRVVVCTPPTNEGVIDALTLVAADICKADEIYKIGGAHGIAALAYGSESIKPVRKIVGPGNKYVTAAKILVSKDVAIDIPAGPSEVLVLADETADPRIVALDMVSQAEHGVDSVSGLVTTSKELAMSVIKELEDIFTSLSRSFFVANALSSCGFVVICDNMHEAVEFTNKFAPEHLEIMTEKPMDLVKEINSAGLILIGRYTPVSASDYCFGTNHVLPTSGFGHIFSGLSVLDFVRRVNVVECSKESLLKLKETISVLAEAENLPNHILAVEGRFNV